MLTNNKGESRIVGMGVGLILLVVLGYIMFPVISGVQTAMPTNTSASWGYPISGAYGNYTNTVAGAITLFGVSPVVYAAAIILVILTVYLARQ